MLLDNRIQRVERIKRQLNHYHNTIKDRKSNPKNKRSCLPDSHEYQVYCPHEEPKIVSIQVEKPMFETQYMVRTSFKSSPNGVVDIFHDFIKCQVRVK